MPREDLTGMQFGSWVVIEYAGDRKWLCECQCDLHTRRAVLASSLKRHSSTCCGDRKMHPKNGDLSGTQIGELKVLRYIGDSIYACQCSCGKIVNVETKQLKRQAITDCGHVKILKVQQKIQQEAQKATQIKPKYKPAGDWTVLGPAQERGYYICQCICGYKRVMSDSSMYNARKNNYECKHVKIKNRLFGSLEVLERKTQKECVCKCHACGKITTVLLGNLLNGTATTCGCSKAPTYNKEQILDIIRKYMTEHNGEKPQPLVLKDLLGLSETATYENIKRYELESYLDRHSSVGEKQIADIFSNQNIIKHDRKVLNGLELDIYLPDLKLAIEYNGSFWHSDERKDKKYHQQKTVACAKQGIQLIHIFDYEWTDNIKRDKLTSYLKGFITQREIYHARNLKLQEISNQEAKNFQDKYHLQNSVNSQYNIALLENNNIISVMSFSKPRFNSYYDYEITRYCIKNNLGIVGGAERLFKYFVDTYKPKSILTYVDISKFKGNIYTKLGFKPTSDFLTSPNYVWVNSHLDVKQRYQTQKHRLLDSGLGTPDQTEDEIMQGLGYTKVYDSGNLKLEWLKEKGDTPYVQ